MMILEQPTEEPANEPTGIVSERPLPVITEPTAEEPPAIQESVPEEEKDLSESEYPDSPEFKKKQLKQNDSDDDPPPLKKTIEFSTSIGQGPLQLS